MFSYMNSLSTLLKVIKSHNSILNQHKNFNLFDLAFIVIFFVYSVPKVAVVA